MPSWNEKANVVQTVNVNPHKCECGSIRQPHHAVRCTPVLLPCPVPRSVTFEVRLGECATPLMCEAFKPGGHVLSCPARPISVSCSISGETWWASEANDLEWSKPMPYGSPSISAFMRPIRDRWALVRALVTGGVYTLAARFPPVTVDVIHRLHMQRDAVFAALADMARAETAAHAAFLALPMDLRKASIVAKQCGSVAADPEDGGLDLPSAKIFALYVERLIEQVSMLEAP